MTRSIRIVMGSRTKQKQQQNQQSNFGEIEEEEEGKNVRISRHKCDDGKSHDELTEKVTK